MSQLYSNCPPYWNSKDHQVSGTLSKSLSLKVDSPPQLHLNTRSLCFSLQDQDSSSSQSTHSNHDLAATAGTNSQEQSLTSESGQEVSCAQNGGQAKPVYLMGLSDGSFNAAQIDYSRTIACVPYSCADPNFNGLLTAYEPPPVIHPHLMGVTTTRVPLPLDISEDEPIYVNAKQYHGILRRRQLRAKMEAQNKLIKVRKPYLHESRHRHALNRVRGTGGRFLSSKKSQQPDSNASTKNDTSLRSTGFGHEGNTLVFEAHQSSRDPQTGNSSGGGYFQQPDRGFSGMSSSHTGGAMQRNNTGFMNGHNQHCASLVQ